MRRLAVLALASTIATTIATAGALGLTILPAAAHICARAVEISIGQPSTVAVGVTVEGIPVPDVTITFPPGLRLDRVDAKAGWTITRTGPNVRFRGGPIETYACEYFSFGVTAIDRGSFGIPVVQRSATAKIVARSTPDATSQQSRTLDQFVYAGITPPSVSSGPGGPSVTTITGLVLVGIGVVGGGILGFRSWRGRRDPDGEDDDDSRANNAVDGRADETREAELQARLEQFKKRGPSPPPT